MNSQTANLLEGMSFLHIMFYIAQKFSILSSQFFTILYGSLQLLLKIIINPNRQLAVNEESSSLLHLCICYFFLYPETRKNTLRTQFKSYNTQLSTISIEFIKRFRWDLVNPALKRRLQMSLWYFCRLNWREKMHFITCFLEFYV